MNSKKYTAPVVEILTLSAKEDCMLLASGETNQVTLSLDFGQLD